MNAAFELRLILAADGFIKAQRGRIVYAGLNADLEKLYLSSSTVSESSIWLLMSHFFVEWVAAQTPWVKSCAWDPLQGLALQWYSLQGTCRQSRGNQAGMLLGQL